MRLSLVALISVTFALGAYGAACAADHPNLSGFWELRSGSVHRAGPTAWNDAAQAELKKPNKMTDPNGVDDSDRLCLPVGQPWTLYQSAPTSIVQDDRETTMLYEDRSLPFHIFTDGRAHPTNLKPSLNGHSIGHWENDEFVVDSVGFSAAAGHGALMSLPNNPTTHVVARYKLAADGKELHAHYRIEDTQWLSHPDEFDVVWYRDPPDEYAKMVVCDPRNPANGRY